MGRPAIPRAPVPQSTMDPEFFRGDIINFAGGAPNIRWERAFPCPCAYVTEFANVEGEVGGEPRLQCTKCKGAKFYYVRQPDTYAIVSGATSQDVLKGRVSGEELRDVKARFTCLPETAPQAYDRLSLLNAWVLVHELRVRRLDVETPRFPLETRTYIQGSEDDPTLPEEVEETVVGAAWANAAGVFQATLELGVAFGVTEAGEIDWTAGSNPELAPPVGSPYTISYWARPRFIVIGQPYVSRTQPTYRPSQIGDESADLTPTDMPVLVIGQMEYIGITPGTTGV